MSDEENTIKLIGGVISSVIKSLNIPARDSSATAIPNVVLNENVVENEGIVEPTITTQSVPAAEQRTPIVNPPPTYSKSQHIVDSDMDQLHHKDEIPGTESHTIVELVMELLQNGSSKDNIVDSTAGLLKTPPEPSQDLPETVVEQRNTIQDRMKFLYATIRARAALFMSKLRNLYQPKPIVHPSPTYPANHDIVNLVMDLLHHKNEIPVIETHSIVELVMDLLHHKNETPVMETHSIVELVMELLHHKNETPVMETHSIVELVMELLQNGSSKDNIVDSTAGLLETQPEPSQDVNISVGEYDEKCQSALNEYLDTHSDIDVDSLHLMGKTPNKCIFTYKNKDGIQDVFDVPIV